MKTRFISMVSHEYRTPLTVILSSSHLLKRYISEDYKDKADNHIQKIQNSVSHMTKLIDDVLVVGKSDNSDFDVHCNYLSIVSFLDEIYLESKVVDAGKHQFEFIRNCDDILFFTDRQLMKQILTNIISNAFKYSMPGTAVIMKLTCDEKNIVISISDKGGGIPESEFNQLFEPFFRNHRYIGNIPGIGLGLTIVKRAMIALGGKVDVKSKYMEGTEFILTFPIKDIPVISKED